MKVLAEVAINYSVRGGGVTHAPMIAALLGGRERRLVLDTGSEVHLLTEDLADELGLTKEPGEEGTDHSGATTASWSVGDVPMPLGGLEVMLRDVVAIDAPPAFRERGIDGILSPQNLHPVAYVVIDLIDDQLLLLGGEHDAVDAVDAVSTFVRARSPAMSIVELPRVASFPSVVVSAAIEGFDQIPTMLNTGGRSTEFASAAVPGLLGDDLRRLGGGVSGSDYAGALVGHRVLVIDGQRLIVPALAVREKMHDPQGIVGMDVLRGTILACAAHLSRPVFWLLPNL